MKQTRCGSRFETMLNDAHQRGEIETREEEEGEKKGAGNSIGTNQRSDIIQSTESTQLVVVVLGERRERKKKSYYISMSS